MPLQTQGAEAVARLVRVAPLQRLLLDNCALGDLGVKVIADGLRASKTSVGHPLRRLTLSRNGFGHGGAAAVGKLLATGRDVMELDVGWNNMSHAGAAAFAAGLATNTSLVV